jgi:beta-glucanase (GH16 family)
MKKTAVYISIMILFHAFIIVKAQVAANGIPVKGYHLVWSDDFTGKKLDSRKWKYRQIGKRGDGHNDRRAIKLDGKGNLVITAFKKADSVFVGIVDSENLFETKFGYFECRAKLTSTSGIWPAFWLQSSKNGENGLPETHGVEIDIFEYFKHNRPDHVSHTLHWGGYGATHKQSGTIYSPLKKTRDGYHTFGLEWTADGYSTYVDGVKTYSTNSLISKVPEFIVLSLEVNKTIAGPLDFNDLPDCFTVDYVRVYKKL